jgi:hypothetical protein
MGAHDRKTVDDTHLEHRKHVCVHDFETREELDAFIAPTYSGRVAVMTKPIIRETHIPEAVMGIRSARTQHRLRNDVKKAFDIPAGANMTMAWGDSRYETLHNMRYRFGPQGGHDRFNTRYIGGVVCDGLVRVVEWKAEYSDRDQSLDDFVPNVAYIYQTTKKTWRFFSVTEDRRVGSLAHQE